jgi:hypothetical protein
MRQPSRLRRGCVHVSARIPFRRSREATESPEDNREGDESGAVIILALVFLLLTSVVVSALLSQAGNNLRNVSHFESGRSLVYANDSATDIAIQNVRYNPNDCTLSMPTIDIPTDANPGDDQVVQVWCTSIPNASSAVTRQVTFSACTASQISAGCSQANPFVQAVIDFDDYSFVQLIANPGPCTATCGSSMTVVSWVVK